MGARVRIARFGGAYEPGTIVAVEEEGRCLQVRADGGELLDFVLNRASARFLAAGAAGGERLELSEVPVPPPPE